MISTRLGRRSSGSSPSTRFAAAAAAGALLATLAAGTASASSLLLSHDRDEIRLLDVTSLPPVAHGPYLTGAFGGGDIKVVLTLRDESAALVLTNTQLHRLELLSPPAAPTIALSATPPFTPTGLIGAGLRDFSLLLGSGGQIAVVDNRTLAIRNTFTVPLKRTGGALSPDGRTLATIALTLNGEPALRVAAFDPHLGLTAEVQPPSGVMIDPPTSVFFSPDGRTLNYVHNLYFFDLTEGPAYNWCYIEPYRVTGPGLVALDDFVSLVVDACASHAYGRDGKQLFVLQFGNFMVDAELRLHRLTATAPATYSVGAPLAFRTQGSGWLTRSAGAKRLYFTDSGYLGKGSDVELHVYDPLAETLSTYDIPDDFGIIQMVETGAGVFADGFESGGTGAWLAAFP